MFKFHFYTKGSCQGAPNEGISTKGRKNSTTIERGWCLYVNNNKRCKDVLCMYFTAELKCHAPKHNRAVTIIKGPEKYETLKSLSNFFGKVNQLISTGTVAIAGEDVELEFFLGGDMKFLLMILELNSPLADYACVWRKIHKDNRRDKSQPIHYYMRNQ